MVSSVEALVRMSEEERHEAMVWIDWRSDEHEVIESFSEQLAPDDALGCNDENAPTQITFRGQSYTNPLTASRADRYVTIGSIAEILQPHYALYTTADSVDGDTHGFLVLTGAQVRELEARHGRWLAQTLQAFQPGIDGFSGLAVPYHGHESEGDPQLHARFAAFDAWLAKRRERILQQAAGKKPFWKFW